MLTIERLEERNAPSASLSTQLPLLTVPAGLPPVETAICREIASIANNQIIPANIALSSGQLTPEQGAEVLLSTFAQVEPLLVDIGIIELAANRGIRI